MRFYKLNPRWQSAMILGVISDTHDDVESLEVALQLFASRAVDRVIHLGDLVSPFTLKPIVQSGIPTILLRGNNEAEFKLAVDALEADNVTFYTSPTETWLGDRKAILFHGFGSLSLTKKVAELLARSGEYELVLYGHTHEVDVRKVHGTLVLNPGEACGCLSGKRTVAILDTDDLSAKIISLNVLE